MAVATILNVPDSFHPMGLPPTFMPPTMFTGSPIDPAVQPSFGDACDVLRERIASLRGYVDALTPDELTRPVDAHVLTVGGALSLIFHEVAAHDRYINRDLDQLHH